MKKILTTVLLLSVMTGVSFAGTGTALKNAIKQDIRNVKTDVKTTARDVKTAVKQDINNERQAQATTAQAKKAEKIKQIDNKLTALNKEMTSVKNDKNITETERVLKVKTLQRQINLYQQQKKALQ